MHEGYKYAHNELQEDQHKNQKMNAFQVEENKRMIEENRLFRQVAYKKEEIARQLKKQELSQPLFLEQY